MSRQAAGVALLLLLLARGILGAGEISELNRITFVNSTGYEILFLFFTPSDSEYWGADILGANRSLRDGEKRGFYLHYPGEEARFDFLAVDADGDAYIIWDVRVRSENASTVVISLDDLEGGYDLPPLATVDLLNQSSSDVWFAFFSPDDGSAWGVDILDEETILAIGERVRIYVPVGEQISRYEFLGLGINEERFEFSASLSVAQLSYILTISESDRRP